jgi:hypothetical protein
MIRAKLARDGGDRGLASRKSHRGVRCLRDGIALVTREWAAADGVTGLAEPMPLATTSASLFALHTRDVRSTNTLLP